MTRIALAALALVLAAGTAPAAETRVSISNFAFDPPSLVVAPGTKVVWTNTDEEPHTVVSIDPKQPFKSPGLDTDDTFSVTFGKPGIYKYFCTIHPHMVGQIIVK